jgi:beta-glucosidase
MLADYHRLAQDKEEAAQRAVRAGVNLELPHRDVYGEPLLRALRAGKVGREEVDALVREVLALKLRLGLFENPFVDEGAGTPVVGCAEHRELAREAARRSFVLLKNEGLLPLTSRLARLAVIGPNAASARNLLGDYAYPCHIETLLAMRQENTFATVLPEEIGSPEELVRGPSLLEALRRRLQGRVEVAYEPGCDVNSDWIDREAACALAAQADAVLLVLGDKSGLVKDCTTGESRDRATVGLPGRQEELARAVIEVGKPTAVVFISGRPVSSPWLAERAQAILEAWLPGEEGAEALVDVLLGDACPGGKLPVTVARSVGQLPLFYRQPPSGGRSHCPSTPSAMG